MYAAAGLGKYAAHTQCTGSLVHFLAHHQKMAGKVWVLNAWPNHLSCCANTCVLSRLTAAHHQALGHPSQPSEPGTLNLILSFTACEVLDATPPNAS